MTIRPTPSLAWRSRSSSSSVVHSSPPSSIIPGTKELIRDVVADIGCSLEDTYLDVPRLRLATSNGDLTAGVGYAFHPHRDTWYSAPMSQLNWWIPIYDFGPDAGMAFHPHYMDEPIKNGSLGSTITVGMRTAGRTRPSTSRPTRACSRSRSRTSNWIRRSGSWARPAAS